MRHHEFVMIGYPIRRSSDQRLLHTSPKLIAATPRPSSPFGAKASAIHPYCCLLRSLLCERNEDACTCILLNLLTLLLFDLFVSYIRFSNDAKGLYSHIVLADKKSAGQADTTHTVTNLHAVWRSAVICITQNHS